MPADVAVYNEIASRVMRDNGVPVDDLFSFANARLKEIQEPVNVHFTAAGSTALGGQVARTIEAALPHRAQ